MEEYTKTFTADLKDEDLKAIFGIKEEEEKKNPRETCVDHAMGSIDQIISGKHFRAIRGAIEQQIRYAYKKGFEDCKNSVDTACAISDLVSKGYREGYVDGANDTWEEAIEIIKKRKETTDGGDKS